MNSVKCYGRFLPASKLDNDRKEEKQFLKNEEILTRIYGEKISNLKIYNDILKKRIKKLTDGVSNLFIVLNNDEKDATMLTVGDGNTSSGILFYLINDLVCVNRSNSKLLITYSHFEIVRNRVNDKLKRYVFPHSNMINVGSCLGCENGVYDWVSRTRESHKDDIPSSGCHIKYKMDEYQQKKQISHGGHTEKREGKNLCRVCIELEENRLINSSFPFDIDSFVKGKKKQKYGGRHMQWRSTGEWDPTAVRKVYLSGQNIRHVFKMLYRSRRDKFREGLHHEVTYEVVQFDVEMLHGGGLDMPGVRSFSDGGSNSNVSNEWSIFSKSSVSTCSLTIIVVKNLKGTDSSERAFLSHFCELFLKREVEENCIRDPNSTVRKKHPLIIKYLFSLYKFPPLRGSTTGMNYLPFELNFIYISNNFKKYRAASEFIYAYLKRLNRSEYFVQPNKKKQYLKSEFHKVDENIYVVRNLLNYYVKLEIRGVEINRRVSDLRNYLTILESSVIGGKRRDYHIWTENRINNVLNLCRSSTSESDEQMQVKRNNSCCPEKEFLFFFKKEGRIGRNYKEAVREKQHEGKYEDKVTAPRSTQMEEKAKEKVKHLWSLRNVNEIKKGKHNPDKMQFKLSLHRRGRTNLVGSEDHSSIDTDCSSGYANLEKCNQHCYRNVKKKKSNVLDNTCKKKEEIILVDPNSHRKRIPVKYASNATCTHCEKDNSLKCRVKVSLPNDENLLHSPKLDAINGDSFPRRSTRMKNSVRTNGINPEWIHPSCMDLFSNTMEVENLNDRTISSHKGKEKKFLFYDILGMAYSKGPSSSSEDNENQLQTVLHNIEQNRDFLKSISTLNSDIKRGKKRIDRRAKSLFEQVDLCLEGDARAVEGRGRMEKLHVMEKYLKLDRNDHPNGTVERVGKNGESQTDRQYGKKNRTKKDYTCVEMEIKGGSRKLALQECAKSKVRGGENNVGCSEKGDKSVKSVKSGKSIVGHRKMENSNNSLTSHMSEGKETNKFDYSDENTSKGAPINDRLDTPTQKPSLYTTKVDNKSKCGKSTAEGISSKYILEMATNNLPDKGKEKKKKKNCVEHSVHLNGCQMDKKSVERIFFPIKKRDSKLALDENELDPLHKDSPWLGQNGGNIENERKMEESTRRMEEDFLHEERSNFSGHHILMCDGESQSGRSSRIAETGGGTHVSYEKGDDKGINAIKQVQEEEESNMRSSIESVFSFSSKSKNEANKDNHYWSSQATDDEILSGCTLDGETIKELSPNEKKKYAVRGSNGMMKMGKKRQNYSLDCEGNENLTLDSLGSQSEGERTNVGDSCEDDLEKSITNYHNNFKKLLKSHMSFLQKKYVDDKKDLELLKKIKFAKGVLREYNNVLGRNCNDKDEKSVLVSQVISKGWGIGDAMFEQNCERSRCDTYSKLVDTCKNSKDVFLRERNEGTDSGVVHEGIDAESVDGGISLTGGQMDLSPFYRNVNEEVGTNEVKQIERCSVERSTDPYRTVKCVDTDKNPPPSHKSKESNYGNSDYVDNLNGVEMENSYTPKGEDIQWEEPQSCISRNEKEHISGENDKNVNASTQYYEENVPMDDPPHKGKVLTCDPNDLYNEYEEEPLGEYKRSALHGDHLDELQNGRRAKSELNYPSKSYGSENPPSTHRDNEEKRNSGRGEKDRSGHVMERDMHRSDLVEKPHMGELFRGRSFSSKLGEREDIVVEDSFMKVEGNSPDCTGEKTTLHSHAVMRKMRRKKKVLKMEIQDEANKINRLSSKKKKLMSFILRAIERGEKDEELITIVRSAIFKMEYFEQKKISKLKRMEKEFQKLTHVEEKIDSNFLMRKSQFSRKKNQHMEVCNRTVRCKNGQEGEDDNKVYQKCGSPLDEKKNKDTHSYEYQRKDKNVQKSFQKKSQRNHETSGVHPLRGGEKKEKKNNCAHVDALQKGRVCNNFFVLNGYNRKSKKSIEFTDLCVNLKKEKYSTLPLDGEQEMQVLPSLNAAKLTHEALTEKSQSYLIPPSGDLYPKEEKNTPGEDHNARGVDTGGVKCRTIFTSAEDAKEYDAFFQNNGHTADRLPKLGGNRLDGNQQHIGHFPPSNDKNARGEFPQWDRDSTEETDKNKDRNITVAYRVGNNVRVSTPRSSDTFKQRGKGKRKTKLGLSYDRQLEGENRLHLTRNPAKECTTEQAENLRLNSSCFSNGDRSKTEGISPSTESAGKSTRHLQVGVKIPLSEGSIQTGERHRKGENIPDKVRKKKKKNIDRDEKKENKGDKEDSSWEIGLGDARTEERPRNKQIEKRTLLGNPNNFHVSLKMDPTRGKNLQRKGSFRRGDTSRRFLPSANSPSTYTPFLYAQREGGYPELIPHSSSLHRRRVVPPEWNGTMGTYGNPLPRCQTKDKAKTKRCEEEEGSKLNRIQRSFINVKHKSTPETEVGKNMEQISIKTVINRQREKTIPCINYDTDRYSFKLGWWNWGKQSKLLENIERCKENIKEKYYQNRKECKYRSSTNWTSKYFTKFQPNEYLYIPVTNKNYFRSKNSLKIRSNPVSDFHKLNLKPITGFLQSYEKEKQRQRQVPQAVIRVSNVPYVMEDYNVKRGVPKMEGKRGITLGEANILLSEDEESNLNGTSGFFAKVSKKSAPSGYVPNGQDSYSSGTNSNDEKNSKGIIFKCRTKRAHKTDNRDRNSGTTHGKMNSKIRLYNIGHDINEGRTRACRKGKAHSGDEGLNEKDGLGQGWDSKKKTTVKVRKYRIRSIESLSSVQSAPGRTPPGCSSSMVRLSSENTDSDSAGSREDVSTTNAKYKVNLKSKKRADYPQGEDPTNTPPSQCSNKSEVQNCSRRSDSSCHSTSSRGSPHEAFQKDSKGDPHRCMTQRNKLTNCEENDEEKILSRPSYKHMNISSKREYPGYRNKYDTPFNMDRESYTNMESELRRNSHRIYCDGSERTDSSSDSIGETSGEGPCRKQYLLKEINQVDYLQPDSYHMGKRKNKKEQSSKNFHDNYYPPTNDSYYEGQHRDSVNPKTRGRKRYDADYLEKQYDEYFYDS
ncbi:conserved Plasmodium protein, unknown function [Plasmodium knowlesi strain H]|uniref:Uncharacterized protein n=3 Tax=Plasmodium knowlesi TaxID=5850 RepID=A0A5K1UI64_PLAKH|nr:conserved Plasmodium protein, unknown function [Plasmodium knowlesi strain H]OTN64906.1 Uncharacterized protein PKNOH_S120157500 [Plasmodium knowlesi]CAA9988431.1 conserved Plasmodium protein, unknown function [Plasmodium knowlesi strain H]SBO19882.1 conserved Plasmodium protein, unknown function [Plasmodium knowlesi strain H]SBO20414.1 conserved Plasmodium protein, unknown function [Plasmodium knowlesi strain H]VVS77905.1 conserved Plasmodium protein, unknown function [Plasmodium knowlesi |eukprot:XP_002259412.1 hypothetical protein, conserved in Plasmodium species [Plasmodium knowlesi strain H]